MRVYLDACCLSRLTDDQSQPRIREEAEAVDQLMRRMRGGSIRWVASEVLIEEIDRNPAMERRLENRALLRLVAEVTKVNRDIACRARSFEDEGYGAFDALHLACAEAAKVDILLTTDDGFIRKASRGDGSPRVPVANPLSWGQENVP